MRKLLKDVVDKKIYPKIFSKTGVSDESGNVIQGWASSIERTGAESYRVKDWDLYVTQIEHRFIASFINPDSNKSSDYSVIAGKTFVYTSRASKLRKIFFLIPKSKTATRNEAFSLPKK